MYTGEYSQRGLEESLWEGFAAREAYVTKMIEDMGGKVEAFYWAYGATDIVVIVDAPADVALAGALAVSSAADSVQLMTTPLITASEMDAARAKLPKYQGPAA
jgi:uncharacterized protein with GYD domain